ncbi:MAG: hypothetical protein ACTTHG_01045 [Treponemataceae bacterium]
MKFFAVLAVLFFAIFNFTGSCALTCFALIGFVEGIVFFADKDFNRPYKFIRRKVTRLLFPFFCWNFIFGFICFLLKFAGFGIGNEFNLKNLFISPIFNGYQFGFNAAAWFIFPLFITQMINVLLRFSIKKLYSLIDKRIIESVLFFLAFLQGLLGFYLACLVSNKGFMLVLERCSFFILFFSLGTFYSQVAKEILNKRKVIFHLFFTVVLFVLLFLLICIKNGIPQYPIPWAIYNSRFFPIITSFIIIGIFVEITEILGTGFTAFVEKNFIVTLFFECRFTIANCFLFVTFILTTFFAVFHKFLGLLSDFNWLSYKTDIFYFYLPQNQWQILIFYFIMATVIPVIVHKLIEKVAKRIFKLFFNNGYKMEKLR